MYNFVETVETRGAEEKELIRELGRRFERQEL